MPAGRGHRLLDDSGVVSDSAGEDAAGVEPPHARACRRGAPSRRRSARSWLAAVWPRSETPTAPRTPNPRSVKLSPLRTARPIPSYGTQRMSEVSTPPVRIRSSSSRPTSLSAKAVTTAVRSPKHRRSPRATLYSPPPSHDPELPSGADPALARVQPQHHLAERDRVVTALLAGFATASAAPSRLAGDRYRLGGQPADLVPGARGDQLGRHHPTAADRQHRRHARGSPAGERR